VSDLRIRRCLENGLSILVASADAQGNPACCRAVGLSSRDDLATLTVYVPMATSQQVIANLATTRRIAVVAVHTIDHSGTQLKGIAETTRVAREDEASLVRRYLSGFASALDAIGVPTRITTTMAHWPAFAIEVRVAEIYDQSPGPKAGGRLRRPRRSDRRICPSFFRASSRASSPPRMPRECRT
jgi:hypothetical protein